MGFPDRIERTLQVAHPPDKVWAALTTAGGSRRLARQRSDDRAPSGRVRPDEMGRRAHRRHAGRTGGGADGVRLHLADLRPAGGRSPPYLVEFTLEPVGAGTRLPWSRPASPNCRRTPGEAYDCHTEGWPRELGELVETSMPPDIEAVAEQVFIALADPSRRAILAALAGAVRQSRRIWPVVCRSPAGDRETLWRCWPKPAW